MAGDKAADSFGPYRVVRQIGSGGMACIFEATDTRLGHRVALKRLHPHVAERPGAMERFLREGRAAARVRHPHVVQVFSLGEEEGSAYLAMELLEGCDLGATLARHGPLSVEPALALLLPVIAAVAAAHDAGVIHRDLKPSNVFVGVGPGGRRWPKVLDFGVSKVLAPDDAAAVTATDGVVGTVAYMAPEHARATRDASFQSDQYSLAVILYQCVTGQLPFSRGSVYELFSAIMTAAVVPPSQRAEQIPPGLDAIVLRAMSRDPRDRFPSVRAFGAALLPLASAEDRATWAVDLHARPADDVSGIGGRTDPVALVADTGTLSTMPPTVRDTQASTARKRVARRALAGLLVSGTLVAASAGAWVLWHRGTEPSHGARPVTTAVSAPEPSTRPSSPELPATAVASPRAAEPVLTLPTLPTSAPLPPAPATTHAPMLEPARRVPRATTATGASPSASAARDTAPLGHNGSPILP